ncbi:hypothetical protein TorRG33x02_110000 [Trema orientale]|uniref:Uncharacterized protein n=1 Tax=Trema orientale TaxID=63057 RepID=A0A2P5F5P0_TREOI|nr:hypothetical protein TorRG33x02_110000 [Trema orientale]
MRLEFEAEGAVRVHGWVKRKGEDDSSPALGHELQERKNVVVIGIGIGRRIIGSELAVQELYY